MQRVAIFALCAIVGMAIVWFLVRSGEPGGGGKRAGVIGAASPSGSTGHLDPSRPGAGPMRAREGSANEPGGGRGPAVHGAATGSSTRSTQAGSSSADLAVAPSDGHPVGQRAARDSDQDAPVSPEEAERWARQQARTEPVASADGEGGEGSPSNPNAPATKGGVLSSDEIDGRVNNTLPDGSMPLDALAKARELEHARILRNSMLAAALAAASSPKERTSSGSSGRIQEPRVLPTR